MAGGPKILARSGQPIFMLGTPLPSPPVFEKISARPGPARNTGNIFRKIILLKENMIKLNQLCELIALISSGSFAYDMRYWQY